MKLLVDISGIAHRSAYKFADLSGPTGEGTGIVFGVLRSLESIAAELDPSEMVICWDGGHAARSSLYKEYKANRRRGHEFIEEYNRQCQIIKFIISTSLPMLQVAARGIEADDVIAALSKHIVAYIGGSVGVVTSDKDLYQLANEHVSIYDYSGHPVVMTMEPQQYVAYKVLVGDPSDNIRGVDGVGDKRARDLLAEHGSLHKVMKAAFHEGKIGRMSYADASSIVRRNEALITLDGRLLSDDEKGGIVATYTKALLSPRGISRLSLIDWLKRLGFSSILQRLSGFMMSFESMRPRGVDTMRTREHRRVRRVVNAKTGKACPTRKAKRDSHESKVVRREAPRVAWLPTANSRHPSRFNKTVAR